MVVEMGGESILAERWSEGPDNVEVRDLEAIKQEERVSVSASEIIDHLDRYVGREVPVAAELYVLGSKEMFLCDDHVYWKHGRIIQVIDASVERVATTLMSFVPALGGGPAVHVVQATVRGKVARARDDRAMATMTDVEELEIRDVWLTARVRLRSPTL